MTPREFKGLDGQRDPATILGRPGQTTTTEETSIFDDHRSQLASDAIRSQDAGLKQFSEYLLETAGQAPTGETLATTFEAWRGITWKQVNGFVKWLLVEGHTAKTINTWLSAVKTYGKLAAKGGAIPSRELTLIQAVQGYKPE
jgi:hypothetical protein